MVLRSLVLCFCTAALARGQIAHAAPVWSHADVAELIDVVAHVSDDGLDPRDYDTGDLQKAFDATDKERVNERATAVFNHLAADFTRGHVLNRGEVAWHLPGPSLPPQQSANLLEQALQGAGVRKTLEGLLPQHRQYKALKAALATTPARDKASVQRLRANLERWRWMPRDLGTRYLFVNVPAFTVSLVENNRVVSRRRVIVGKISTPTPQFGAMVTGAILNPWWEIPPSIVRESVGKLVSTRPAEARARGYVVANGRYRQSPGPGNALGQVKLIMPNPYTIYLHDTPSKQLFDEDIRAFSHGCIRVQDALGLAEDLLSGGARSGGAMGSLIKRGTTTAANLATPVPVYVTYFTAAADEDGKIATFPDVYGRDVPIVTRLVDRETTSSP